MQGDVTGKRRVLEMRGRLGDKTQRQDSEAEMELSASKKTSRPRTTPRFHMLQSTGRTLCVQRTAAAPTAAMNVRRQIPTSAPRICSDSGVTLSDAMTRSSRCCHSISARFSAQMPRPITLRKRESRASRSSVSFNDLEHRPPAVYCVDNAMMAAPPHSLLSNARKSRALMDTRSGR